MTSSCSVHPSRHLILAIYLEETSAADSVPSSVHFPLFSIAYVAISDETYGNSAMPSQIGSRLGNIVSKRSRSSDWTVKRASLRMLYSLYRVSARLVSQNAAALSRAQSSGGPTMRHRLDARASARMMAGQRLIASFRRRMGKICRPASALCNNSRQSSSISNMPSAMTAKGWLNRIKEKNVLSIQVFNFEMDFAGARGGE